MWTSISQIIITWNPNFKKINVILNVKKANVDKLVKNFLRIVSIYSIGKLPKIDFILRYLK